MSVVFEHTVRESVAWSGVGLHSGAPVRATVRPAAARAGIVFRRVDLAGDGAAVEVAAVVGNVCDGFLSTSLCNRAGVRVATVEHLLAALLGLGIDNAIVEVDGPELPIMDGSAAPFVEGLQRAGRRRQGMPREIIEVLRPVEVAEAGKSIRIEPARTFSISFVIDFAAAAVAQQRRTFRFSEAAFLREIGAARTFGFLQEVDQLRARGLARGGSLENAVVVSGDRVLNDGGLRFPDEFVRHKILDCLGDLSLAGAPLLGRVEAVCSGHSLNQRLVAALLAQPDAWRRVVVDARPAAAPEVGTRADIVPLGAAVGAI